MESEFTIRGDTLRQLRSLGDLNSTEEEVLARVDEVSQFLGTRVDH